MGRERGSESGTVPDTSDTRLSGGSRALGGWETRGLRWPRRGREGRQGSVWGEGRLGSIGAAAVKGKANPTSDAAAVPRLGELPWTPPTTPPTTPHGAPTPPPSLSALSLTLSTQPLTAQPSAVHCTHLFTFSSFTRLTKGERGTMRKMTIRETIIVVAVVVMMVVFQGSVTTPGQRRHDSSQPRAGLALRR
ncbi:hypothetical protein O3P69_007058 [Scylla paramamosain]|uniref:Uncharacterized protein n=1 Tax=Scylla paramamosain TaxID=85552 RepID=A0AAW0V3T9_SCYPA